MPVPPGGYRQAGYATQHRVLSVKTCWPYGVRAYGDSTKAGFPAGGGTDTRCIDQICVRPSDCEDDGSLASRTTRPLLLVPRA